MACVTKLESLCITSVLLFALGSSAPAQTQRDSSGDFVLRLFARYDAKHRSARRNLEAILRSQPEFWREIHAVAARLGTDPAWLLNVLAYESLFDPAARNPLPGQTASGLLQIIEETARSLGTTTNAIRRMSPLEQLRLVERYLTPFRGRLDSLADVYLAVFRGVVIEGGDEVVIVDSGKEPRLYDLNTSLDLNKDKRITKGELGLAALSVGRFLPARPPRSGGEAGNKQPARTIFVRGKGKTSQRDVDVPRSEGRAAAEPISQPPRPTRSIFIRTRQSQ
jgi:Transglycosylase SLT domain